jgi:hypothetical protein
MVIATARAKKKAKAEAVDLLLGALAVLRLAYLNSKLAQILLPYLAQYCLVSSHPNQPQRF